MKKYSFALLFISALLVFSPVTQADEEQELNQREQELNQREQELNQREQSLGMRGKTYGDKVEEKAWRGFTNINTAVLEIPKSIINTTNESNVAFGFIGGTVKGILNTVGRMMSGLTDLVTAPIITKRIVEPNYIWNDFDAETTYGEVFRLDNEPVEQVSPVTTETSTKAAPATTRVTTHPDLDQMFKDEVMK